MELRWLLTIWVEVWGQLVVFYYEISNYINTKLEICFGIQYISTSDYCKFRLTNKTIVILY